MIIDGHHPFDRHAVAIREASHRIGLRLSALCALIASALFIAAFSLSVLQWYAVKESLEADIASFRDAAAKSEPWAKSKAYRPSKLTEPSATVPPQVLLERHLQTAAVANARPAIWLYTNGLALAVMLYVAARMVGWIISRPRF